jgi:hypothetical protein
MNSSGYSYPKTDITISLFAGDLRAFFPKPQGLVESEWPPTQVEYLGVYLRELGCKTVLAEAHYMDRDYVDDVALFYSRSLRSYPNYCQRLHFFSETFDQNTWHSMVVEPGSRDKTKHFLQNSYLGFCVVRPLPGSPLGRTVVPTLGPDAKSGARRSFGAVRPYEVHLAGYTLQVVGLVFQQQDQGVSACATTALWSSMHNVTKAEGLTILTPAEITEAASRYALPTGRALPSEGLTIQQICEATRAAGLQPVLIPSVSLDHDRAQLLAYLSSGFAPVLALQPLSGSGVGHAVCAVGLKTNQVRPQTNPALLYKDRATSVCGIYIHDDRLGPYAAAELVSWTAKDGRIRTAVFIRWPDADVPTDQSLLQAIIVPVPAKLRMSLTRIRALGHGLVQAAAVLFPEFAGQIVFNCRYQLASDYLARAADFELSNDGCYALKCETVLSRFIGLIEITNENEPLFDVLLDATETLANPSALAVVGRKGLPAKYHSELANIALEFAARLIL